MNRIRKSLRRDKRGFTGLEAAIVLTAFIVVAAVFSYVVLNAGFFTTQKSKEVIHTGVKQATSSVELGSDVIGYGTTGSTLNKVELVLQTTSGGEPVDTRGTVISYSDKDEYVPNIVYGDSEGAGNFTAEDISGTGISDGDTMIDPGEKWKFTVNLDYLKVDSSEIKSASDLTAKTINVSFASETKAITKVNAGELKPLKFANDTTGNLTLGSDITGKADTGNDELTITDLGDTSYLNGTKGAAGSLTIKWSGSTITSASGVISAGTEKIDIKTMTGTVTEGSDYVKIEVTSITYNYISGEGLSKPGANEQFTLQVMPPVGSTLTIERTLPAYIDEVMDLF